MTSAASDDRKTAAPNTHSEGDYVPRLRHAKSAKSIDPRTDPKRLLEYLLETLCSLRATSKTFDFEFLAYLIEMAALEAEHQLKLKVGEDKSEGEADLPPKP